MEERKELSVWLLGAGAAVPGSLPIMKNYMKTVQYCYKHDLEEHPDEKSFFDVVLRYVQEKIETGVLEDRVKDDMEAVFSLLDTEAELAGDERAKSVRPHLTFTIMRTFQLCHDHGPADNRLRQGYSRQKAREFYNQFVEKVIADRGSIITFNQDLLVDAAVLKAGLKPEYHLPPGIEDINGNLKPGSSGPDLLKLHGSGNWYYCPVHQERRFVHWFVEKDKEKTENWAASKMSGCCKQNGATLDRLMIPPTWRKAYDTPFLEIWKKAYEHLITATRLIIIGYSLPLTDQFFRFFLLSALAARQWPLDHVVIVDKANRYSEKDNLHDRWAFLEHFLIPEGKIQYHFDGFEVALDHL